jgi:hypothetical protein
MELTIKQKEIYNLYIQSLAIASNRPYKNRKNFDNLKEDVILHLVKLETFFAKFPHLFRIEFFNAPYKIYPDAKKYYSLNFYSGHKGLTTCAAYFKTLKKSDPDDQIDYIKESLKFITEFCIEKKIPLSKYVEYKSVAQNDFLLHLKQHKVSFYVIFDIPDLYLALINLRDDEWSLYFGDDIDINDIRILYERSKVAKPLIKEKIKQISLFILNRITK